MKNKCVFLISILVLLTSFCNIVYAKSVYCTYGGTISVQVGIDETGTLVSNKLDQNPANYHFNNVSAGAFVNTDGKYFCPSSIYYKFYSANAGNRYFDYDFSFISTTSGANQLQLTDSKIDNQESSTDKKIDHICAYGNNGQYVINYYKDGTIGPAVSNYSIYNDIPTSGSCLDNVYLCHNILYKTPHADNNNCVRLEIYLKDLTPGGSTMTSDKTYNEPSIDYDNLCNASTSVKNAVRIVGYIIQVCRWLAPLIIIILGMIDFAKATISSDEKAINSAVKSLITRIILGVVIFIIPALVTALIDALGNVTNGIEDQGNNTFGACTRCLFDPFECRWQSKTGGTTGTTNSNNNGKFNEVYYE